jgi:hypothetical protein
LKSDANRVVSERCSRTGIFKNPLRSVGSSQMTAAIVSGYLWNPLAESKEAIYLPPPFAGRILPGRAWRVFGDQSEDRSRQ